MPPWTARSLWPVPPDFRRRGGNPRVGCVLLGRDGSLVAEGYHRGAGTAHAEADALAGTREALGDLDATRSPAATAVVTLEPCAHHGRTGPCADLLIGAGVRRVIFAQSDPNPIAAGGAQRLREAGVEVVAGYRAADALKVNADWTFAQLTGRPRIRLKIAATLDGRVAASDGTSRWITSSAARADGHRLRAAADAVLVGTGTVLADDPLLTVRSPDAVRSDQPLRAVFGTTPVPATAAIRETGPGLEAPLVLTTRSPDQAVAELRARGVSSVLIEGGPRTAAIFLAAGVVDEVISYIAPAMLGAGPSAVGDLGITSIATALRGEITDVVELGSGAERCVRITTRLEQRAADHNHTIRTARSEPARSEDSSDQNQLTRTS
nr:bifunctional diaminohydroxyphosphoribosylaminopyrimidine deaminase/5-amino-6-(5-phosphoribosylamino)uracil reductase RibD [Microlunatus sp. Gsoil 973]